jgi:regulatory protein
MPAADSERAVALAWKAVSTRERTEHELRSYLESKKIEPAAIEEAVAELAAAGYVDDANFARCFAEDRRATQSWGRERIERDLLRRGVDRGLIERALAAGEEHDELAAAIDVLGDRFAAPPDDDRERNRAWQLLVRRGYNPELAYEAVRRHGRKAA